MKSVGGGLVKVDTTLHHYSSSRLDQVFQSGWFAWSRVPCEICTDVSSWTSGSKGRTRAERFGCSWRDKHSEHERVHICEESIHGMGGAVCSVPRTVRSGRCEAYLTSEVWTSAEAAMSISCHVG